MKKVIIIAAMVLVVPATSHLLADVLFMKDGSTVEGTILVEAWSSYYLRDGSGKQSWFGPDRVAIARYGDSWKKKYNLIMIGERVIEAHILADECDYLLIGSEAGKPLEKVYKKQIRKIPDRYLEDTLLSSAVEKKRTGWYFTGVPLVAYSNDNGFRGGARVYFIDNSDRSDPLFYRNPYKLKSYVQFTASTKEMYEGQAELDWKNINGSIFGVTTKLEIEKKFYGLYFGTGNNTTRAPLTDNLGNRYLSYAEYSANFLSLAGMAKYNSYQYLKIDWDSAVSFDWGAPWKFRAGYHFQWMEVVDWSSQGAYTTLLGTERPLGYGGGFISALTAGVAFDLRDFAPDPKKGILLTLDLEGAANIFGSTYGFFRTTAEVRAYYTFWNLLTLAFRASYRAGTPGMPFYEQFSLGGYESLRGFLVNRFVGSAVTLFNLEARLGGFDFLLWGQRFGIKVVGFFDAGNAYSSFGEPFSAPRFGDYRLAGGAGLIGTWNQSTVIHFYVGVSSEDVGISINFGHTF